MNNTDRHRRHVSADEQSNQQAQAGARTPPIPRNGLVQRLLWYAHSLGNASGVDERIVTRSAPGVRPLTLFLRQAGAPLDNNIVERALKRAVLHWKNALFYRALHGAQVGDLFMSLIHTCHLCGANSFDYLTQLQRHAQKLAASPAEWMPWNYRETLERIVSLSGSA